MDRLKEIFSKIITLSYPKYRIVVFSTVLIFLAFLPIRIVAVTHKLSICSNLLGKYCLSTGITRGVSSLLKGNFSEAVNYNVLSIPVLIVILLIIIFDLIKIMKKQ